MATTSSKSERVEIITSMQRRRRWSPSEKQLKVKPMNRELGALTGVACEEKVVPESELKKAHDRIRRLENILGRKTEEVEVLKEAVRLGREKNSYRVRPCAACRISNEYNSAGARCISIQPQEKICG